MSPLAGSRDATEDGPTAPAPRARQPMSPRSQTAARVGAAAALIAAIAAIVVIVFGGGSGYVVHADFQDASGLVTGDNVLIGPAAVGTVSSINLTRDGQAQVTMSLHGTGTLHQGTVARIAEDSLSGIASKYVELEPGSSHAPAIQSGGSIGIGHTYAEVNIDELFDSLGGPTRRGLSNLIRGEATSLKGKGTLANRTLEYFAPGLAEREPGHPRARAQRAGVRRPRRPGRGRDEDARQPLEPAEQSDRQHLDRHRRDRAPESGAPERALAAALDAHPLAPDVRRPGHDARRARAARERRQAGLPAPGTVRLPAARGL